MAYGLWLMVESLLKLQAPSSKHNGLWHGPGFYRIKNVLPDQKL